MPNMKEGKDHDGDGDIDSDDYLAAKDKAIKSAMGKEESTDHKEDGDPCWKDYEQVGMKKKNGKDVPNCVKEEEIPEGMNAIRADAGPPKRTVGMSMSGQEPAGDKLLKKASQGFSNFMNRLNPKAMGSKPAGPQRKPLISTPKEEVEVTGEVVEEGKKELSREKRNKMFRRAGNLSRDALAGGEKGSEAHKKSGKIVKALNKDANENDRNDVKEETLEEKKGLWANIHAKRERGEAPAKKGDKDYPKTLKIESTDHLTEAAPAIVGVLAKMAAKKAAVHVAKKGVDKVQDKMGKLIKGDEEEEEG